jgi:GxxExxY protein
MERPSEMRGVRKPDLLFPEESYKIKRACLNIHNKLGCGFLEKVYENALAHELKKAGFVVEQQVPIRVTYDGVIVGDYVIDLLANSRFIIEVKATENDHPVYKAQTINYVRAANFQLGFLANFGMRSLYFKRLIFTKYRPPDPQAIS